MKDSGFDNAHAHIIDLSECAQNLGLGAIEVIFDDSQRGRCNDCRSLFMAVNATDGLFRGCCQLSFCAALVPDMAFFPLVVIFQRKRGCVCLIL